MPSETIVMYTLNQILLENNSDFVITWLIMSKQKSEIEIPLSEAIRASLPVLSMSLSIIKLNV
jgi:hypothetical protein